MEGRFEGLVRLNLPFAKRIAEKGRKAKVEDFWQIK